MLGILSLALLGAAVPPHACESLTSVPLPQATVTSAAVIPAGPFVPPGGGRGRQGAAPEAVEPIPEHCRVKIVLKPTPDSNINVELWLPTANWNGRFLAVGNGGFAGSIQGYGEMQIALTPAIPRLTVPAGCSGLVTRKKSWISRTARFTT
jgi:feruloyl esterase